MTNRWQVDIPDEDGPYHFGQFPPDSAYMDGVEQQVWGVWMPDRVVGQGKYLSCIARFPNSESAVGRCADAHAQGKRAYVVKRGEESWLMWR